MPLNDPKDFGSETENGPVCIHCSTADGKVKGCEEIFEGGVQFFMHTLSGADRVLAEKLTRKNMNSLPYWQKNKSACLEGDLATDQEFQDALSKL